MAREFLRLNPFYFGKTADEYRSMFSLFLYEMKLSALLINPLQLNRKSCMDIGTTKGMLLITP